MVGPGIPSDGRAGPDAVVRLRLDIAYDGTDFSGWAAQPGRRTVAGVLVERLDRIFGAVTGLTVAGRTDAGVHATGQVAHIEVPTIAWAKIEDTVVRRLAGLLPSDVRVARVVPVPAAFDARFSALSRRYQYRVSDDPPGASPLRARDTLSWFRPLDIDRLNAAAKRLVGLHDFAAFCKRKPHGTTVRAISRLDWARADDGVIVATVAADAFCQAMVRSLVGSLLPVGEGRRPVDWPGRMLTRTERADDIVVAPPHGLNLVEVRYPPDDELAARAELTRNLREIV